MSLTASYSGVVINQNDTPTGMYDWRSQGANYLYQTFTLPSDYTRGALVDEQNIPDISGFQFYVDIDSGYAASAGLDYKLEYYDQGWITLASGTVVGAHSDGLCWFDVILSNSVPVTTDMLSSIFHIGIQARSTQGGVLGQPVTISSSGQYVIEGVGYTANLTTGVPYPITVNSQPAYLLKTGSGVTWGMQQGISTIGYVDPTPLVGQAISQGQVYQADQLTPLMGTGTTASLNFRVLGLVADSGTDFLGNSYRSAVVTHGIHNTAATAVAKGTGSSTADTHTFHSPPQPSRFAVVPTYWDVRPVPENPTYGLVNVVPDPSFEYDAVGSTPYAWTANGIASVQNAGATLAVVTGGESGQNAMRVTTDGTTSAEGAAILLPSAFTSGHTYTFSVYLKGNAGGESVSLQLWAAASTGGADLAVTLTNTWRQYTLTWVPTTNFATNTIYASVGQGTGQAPISFDVDAAMVVEGASSAYFDGDMVGYQWGGQVGQSVSVQVIEPTVQNNSIVIDSVLVDPVTPNMAFNVYYSTDDTGNQDNMAKMTDTDWESKLWTRVPEVYIATQRQEYVFPEPIVAKYVCVEFTNLQSQPYDPGAFQQAVTYKKFPTWVANFFIAEMEMPSFITDQINVQYDALDFMYNYYLDDLHQAPATPTAVPKDAVAQLTSYFNQQTATQGVDTSTLAKIQLVMNRFTQTPDNNVDPTSALGSFVQGLYTDSAAPNATIEASSLSPIDYSAVSSLMREPVVFEQTLPVMFFFLTCRHGYKELKATFDHNRAYFCGVNEISFLREDYTTQADTPIYIESGGDLQNARLNDFIMSNDGSWYASLGNATQ